MRLERALNGSHEVVVPTLAEEQNVIWLTPGTNDQFARRAQSIVDPQIIREFCSVNKFASQPLVKQGVQVDQLLAIFDGNRPIMGDLHERLETLTIPPDVRETQPRLGGDSH